MTANSLRKGETRNLSPFDISSSHIPPGLTILSLTYPRGFICSYGLTYSPFIRGGNSAPPMLAVQGEPFEENSSVKKKKNDRTYSLKHLFNHTYFIPRFTIIQFFVV